MKILFLINQFAGGGRERRMVELVKGLDKVEEIKMHCIVFHNRVDYTDVQRVLTEERQKSLDYLKSICRA